MKECDILEEVKTYSDPPTYFQGVRTPSTPSSTPLLMMRVQRLSVKLVTLAQLAASSVSLAPTEPCVSEVWYR